MRKSERASVVANDAAKPTDDGLGSVASGVELKNLQWQHGEHQRYTTQVARSNVGYSPDASDVLS